MITVSYTDEYDDTYEVAFDYDPDKYDEDDPSQSGWHYITVESITDSDGEPVDFDDYGLYDLKKWIWKEYKNEF